MPTCHITISEKAPSYEVILSKIDDIRNIVAQGLDSKSRLLDNTHIAVRISSCVRSAMLADIEIEMFCQFFWRRFFSRDKRAHRISEAIHQLLGCECATWINLCQVGYNRVDNEGHSHYSIKADDDVVLEKRKQAMDKGD
ncbi:MAG: hypothetical protein LBL82_06455 [Oscillospiraceae bacterium]|jgi:hypothetical protein|nr:hypothetical protein [Oscillospiraceae bacterium]